MFPYVEPPSFRLGPILFQAFDVLVVIAVLVGHAFYVRRAEALGVDGRQATRVFLWGIFWGFLGAHAVHVLAYRPEMLRADPLAFLKPWTGGISSFGGIVGGLLGAAAAARLGGLDRRAVWSILDAFGFGFPFAWIFGRLGCALAHDHPGVPSQSLLAVRFPDGPRLDLGLLELLATIPIALAFVALARRPRPAGFFLGLFLAIYGPLRFVLDVHRVRDTRILGWTPGQYFSVAALAVGLWMLARVRAVRRPAPGAPPPKASPAAPPPTGAGG